jgi:hypothetical protein
MPEFSRAGWSEVTSEPPSPELLALSPELPLTKGAQLLLQFRTAVLQEEHLENTVRWMGREDAPLGLREAALEALGRSQSGLAQVRLAGWLASSLGKGTLKEGEPEERLRTRGLELLKAGEGWDAPGTQVLVRVLTSREASPKNREQAAYSLALAGKLRPDLGAALDSRLQGAEARALLGRMRERL